MNDELKHWGIPGMKWGVRRYQNKDGSLTPLGKKRLEEIDKKQQALEAAKQKLATASNKKPKGMTEDYLRRTKPLYTLTDQEVQQLVNRLSNEDRIKDYMDKAAARIAEQSAKKPSKTKTYIKNLVGNFAKKTIVPAATDILSSAVKEKIQKYYDDNLASPSQKAAARKKKAYDDAAWESKYWTNKNIAKKQKAAYES